MQITWWHGQRMTREHIVLHVRCTWNPNGDVVLAVAPLLDVDSEQVVIFSVEFNQDAQTLITLVHIKIGLESYVVNVAFPWPGRGARA